MILFPLLIVGIFFGLILASFMLIAGWFAWTPLPLIARMPLALTLLAPFGLLAASLPHERELATSVGSVLWLCLLAALVADRSASFVGCLGMLFLFCVVPLGAMLLYNNSVTDELHPSAYGVVVVLMLSLSLICAPVRWLGYRLERLSVEATDEMMRLMTGQTVDDWIRELDQFGDAEVSFAEVMRMLRDRGVPEASAKVVVKSMFRALGRPAPRLASIQIDGGLSSMLQWATTGPSRDQYSMTQLMLLVAASAILFAALARTGIDPVIWSYFLAGIPALFAAGMSLLLLGCGWLLGKPTRYWFLMVSAACLLFGMSVLWIEQMQIFPARFLIVLPVVSMGTFAILCYWMFHLRREGFRLMRSH